MNRDKNATPRERQRANKLNKTPLIQQQLPQPEPVEEPRPGTIGSKQRVKPPKRMTWDQRKASAHNQLLKHQKIDTKGYVDESIVAFITEVGQMQGWNQGQMPNNPIDICKSFKIFFNELGDLDPPKYVPNNEVINHSASPKSDSSNASDRVYIDIPSIYCSESSKDSTECYQSSANTECYVVAPESLTQSYDDDSEATHLLEGHDEDGEGDEAEERHQVQDDESLDDDEETEEVQETEEEEEEEEKETEEEETEYGEETEEEE